MKIFNLKLTALVLAGAFVFASCEKEDETPQNPNPPQLKTIAATATDNGNFTILLDALTRTGLADKMADANQTLTVFAPTDKAFMDLLAELNLNSLDEVETALGTEGLKNVLMYHVLGAKVTSDMVSTGYVSTMGMNATMDPLSIYVNTMSGVKINNRAMVETPDVMASNGVIHIVDKVILPLTIYELLEMNADYATLTAALGLADGGLDDLMKDANEGPFTLFAPDENAFAMLLTELSIADVPALVAALGTDGLAEVLTYHVVDGNVNSDEVPAGMVPTVNGDEIMIDLSNGVVITDKRNRQSNVVETDIQGTNGVIHAISKVILPTP
ncbi:MAG: fasciclin domain-containing protein [Schleiferiaceae bacterium]|nr:fasciclin domain-containing protein [Schleiferiaceae bacterium]